MLRPSLTAMLLGLPLLAACAAPNPAANQASSSEFGDQVRSAALSAPQLLGDTSRYAGRPGQAALAAAEMEVLAEGFSRDQRYRHEISGTTLHTVRLGRAELRRAIGIAPDAPAGTVISKLREASTALEAGRPSGAETALSGPAFPEGPQTTLAHLSSLPYLRRVSDAAGAANSEIRTLDSPRTDGP